MLSVICIWLYIAVTTFIMGYGVLRVITRHTALFDEKLRKISYSARSADAYFICGLVCVTVYAQFFSLFAGVGLAAHVILCAFCALVVLADRRAFAAAVRRLVFFPGQSAAGEEGAENRMPDRGKCMENGGTVRRGAAGFCVMCVLFLLFAYGTSRGMIHYDTGLYHAQSIRWIEEYGVVKGLGNLHCRLAYNSSSFALSALYSMAFLGGQSYHCAAGWLAFLMAAVCLSIGRSLRAGRLRTSDFARLMCAYYLVNIFDEMISPASDYFMVLVAFYIVIKWLDLSESRERTILPYALLCVLGVFLMTVKLSAALILLLTVYPACRLLREKRWGETLLYLALGIVTALPFFIRNVVISGWLVYPFTQLDLFDVVWKIPKGLVDYDAKEIQVWGRGYTDVTRFGMPVREWLPGWFGTLAGSDKVLVLAAAAAVAVFLLQAVYLAWRRCRARRTAGGPASVSAFPAVCSPSLLPLLTVQATAAASFLFWLCTSPLIRYGCVWVYLTAAVVFGGICDMVMSRESCREGVVPDAGARAAQEKSVIRVKGSLRRRPAAGLAVSVLAALLLLYKGIALTREIAGSYVNDYWIVQKDYENYETYAYEIEGVSFYCPVEGDRVGYEAFPSSPARAQIAFLGEKTAEGFRAAE